MTKEEYNQLRVGDTIQQMYGLMTGKITKISREPITQKPTYFEVEWGNDSGGNYGAEFFKTWVRLPEPPDPSLPTGYGFYWFRGTGVSWDGRACKFNCPVYVGDRLIRPLSLVGESIKLASCRGEWVELTEDKIFGGR